VGKRLIREHIICTRALIGTPWHEAVKLFLGEEGRKLRAYRFVVQPWAKLENTTAHRLRLTDEEQAEIIALLAAPLSHASHIKRISVVTEVAAVRYSDALKRYYSKETPSETEVRRARAAKAERVRLRKLPRG